MSEPVTEKTRAWYADYYRQQGELRNDLLQNPEVAFQQFANDAALLKGLRAAGAQASETTMLDVGCGSGAGLVTFLRLGFPPAHLHGIDLQPERLALARDRLPGAALTQGDASRMPYADGTFGLVFESTMFVQLTDEPLAESIAAEMLRVCRPQGAIVLSDWRYSKPFNPAYRGLDRGRIDRLFQVGRQSIRVAQFRAALVPPVGRRLSRFASPFYFICHALFPFLSGHVVTVLRRV